MKADPKTEAEVLATLDRVAEGYARKDVDLLLSLYAPDAIALGSGPDEKNIGIDQMRQNVERDLEQTEGIEISYTWTCASCQGAIAWLASEGALKWRVGGIESSSPFRFTAVLERRDRCWLFVQTQFSFVASDQPEGSSFPTPIEAVATAVREERPDLRAQAAPDGTVTMLFTDIENSTNLTERLGDTQWLDVLRQHNAVVREQVKEHRCFEVKSQGDGFMIASQSARRAVHCAIGIQRALAARNDALTRSMADDTSLPARPEALVGRAESPRPENEPILVRMGLHTGEVLKDADDFFGKHVILASRIAGKARGGEILVSSLLRELTESAGDLRFGDEREVELKGLSGAHRVHEVLWNGA